MSSSNGFSAHRRDAHRNSSAVPTTLKRRFDNRGQEERNRHAPPQKRAKPQTREWVPMYDGRNMSRVCNYGDVVHSSFSSQCNTNYPKPFGSGDPNPQLVPLPLPYRKLDDFDSLPEWAPNQSPNHSNFPIRLVPEVRFDGQPHYHQPPAFTNFPNPMPMNMNSFVPQQPIVSKDLSAALLSVFNSEIQSQNEPPLGLSFHSVMLGVRHESAIKSVYADLPRQCASCGTRFKCQEDHSQHMDWHVRKNRRAKETNARLSQKPNKSRVWYPCSSLFLSAATTEAAKPCFNNANEESRKTDEQPQSLVVPADLDQPICALCQEPFVNFFSDEADDWMYKDAVYMKAPGPIVHAKCMPETRKAPSKIMSATAALAC